MMCATLLEQGYKIVSMYFFASHHFFKGLQAVENLFNFQCWLTELHIACALIEGEKRRAPCPRPLKFSL